jgi:hypothetical protein
MSLAKEWPMRRTIVSLLVAGVVLGLAGTARAGKGLVCEKVEDGLITVDGLRQDWQQLKVNALGAGQIVVGDRETWKGAGDLSAELRCGYDDKGVYLLVEVTDDQVVRTPRAGDQEDRVELLFDAGDGKNVAVLRVHGPTATQGPKFSWVKGGGAARALKLKVVRLEKGWALEAGFAPGGAPGVVLGSPSFRMTVRVVDVDGQPSAKPKTVMASGGDTPATLGVVEYEAARASYATFLREKGLGPANVLFHRVGNFVTGPALERLVIAGHLMALMGDDVVKGGGYYAMPVPLAQSQADLLRFRAEDLDGDGKLEVLLVVRQQGGQGLYREVFFIFKFLDKGSWDVIFAHEIVKRAPGVELVNAYALSPRKPKGFELTMSYVSQKGLSKDSYEPTNTERVDNLLVPWEGAQKKVFVFGPTGATEKIESARPGGRRPPPRRPPPRRRR